MNEERIAIVGYGIVGKCMAKILGIPRKDCYDIGDKKSWGYEYYILCLPSPTAYRDIPYLSSEYKIQDLGAIESWLVDFRQHDRKATVIIRSTVLPGTTKKYSKQFKLKIVHVPEFLSEKTALKDEKNPEFLVIGSSDVKLANKVLKIFLKGCTPKKIIRTDPTTAELIKYTMNSFFGLKVIFSNQIWDVARIAKADYTKVTEALESHKWGSKNGWKVLDKGYRGYKGSCLPKDIKAFISAFDLPLLSEVDRINGELIKDKK
ncbi:MAG: hypothetical protein U1C56_02655 [Candidatus Curtissbacteria bacterium]|nr:hypothetical protein [Candidatus Curtissbacteria bacterium]